MPPFDRPYTTFYWSAIVYIALSNTIFALLDVEKYRDLEIWVRACKGVRCPPIFSLSNLINVDWLVRKCVNIYTSFNCWH